MGDDKNEKREKHEARLKRLHVNSYESRLRVLREAITHLEQVLTLTDGNAMHIPVRDNPNWRLSMEGITSNLERLKRTLDDPDNRECNCLDCYPETEGAHAT